jgi:hypothetical protein
MRTDIDTIYIGGEWITTLSTSRIEIRSPAPAARAACWLVGSQQIRRYEPKRALI